MIQLSTLPTGPAPTGPRAPGFPLSTTSDFALALADLAAMPAVAVPTVAGMSGVPIAAAPVADRTDVAVDGKDLPVTGGETAVPALEPCVEQLPLVAGGVVPAGSAALPMIATASAPNPVPLAGAGKPAVTGDDALPPLPNPHMPVKTPPAARLARQEAGPAAILLAPRLSASKAADVFPEPAGTEEQDRPAAIREPAAAVPAPPVTDSTGLIEATLASAPAIDLRAADPSPSNGGGDLTAGVTMRSVSARDGATAAAQASLLAGSAHIDPASQLSTPSAVVGHVQVAPSDAPATAAILPSTTAAPTARPTPVAPARFDAAPVIDMPGQSAALPPRTEAQRPNTVSTAPGHVVDRPAIDTAGQAATRPPAAGTGVPGTAPPAPGRFAVTPAIDTPAPTGFGSGPVTPAPTIRSGDPLAMPIAEAPAPAPAPREPALPGRAAVTIVPLPPAASPGPEIQPAAQMFAAAMFATARPADATDDEPGDALPLALLAGDTAMPLRPAVPAVSGTAPADGGTLDLTREDWMTSMIDRIETLRDDGGAIRETRMKLAPDALGRVEVSVARDDAGQLQVRIAADTPQARAILSEAAPRLAEMVEARGLRLGGTSVDAGGGGATDPQRREPQPTPSTPLAPRRATGAANDPAAITDTRIA